VLGEAFGGFEGLEMRGWTFLGYYLEEWRC
jgi:hypothetical protein